MNSLLLNIIKIAAVFVVTWIMSNAFGFVGGIIGFLACIAVIAYMSRAVILFLAGSYKFNDNHELGLKLMEKAYKTGKLSTKYSLTYAFLVLRDGQLDKAEKLINKITYLKKQEIQKDYLMLAKINEAIIMWKKGELSQAIATLEEMYDKGYVSTTFYGTLGYFYILDGQISKAFKFNLEGFEYNGTNLVIQDNLANNYLLMAEYDKAQEMYDKLLKQNPEFIEPYYNYAKLMEIRGNKQSAIEYYNKALQYEEKFLSTITHEKIRSDLKNLEEQDISSASSAEME